MREFDTLARKTRDPESFEGLFLWSYLKPDEVSPDIRKKPVAFRFHAPRVAIFLDPIFGYFGYSHILILECQHNIYF